MKVRFECDTIEDRDDYEAFFYANKFRRAVESFFAELLLATEYSDGKVRAKLSSFDYEKFCTLKDDQYQIILDTFLKELEEFDVPKDHVSVRRD